MVLTVIFLKSIDRSFVCSVYWSHVLLCCGDRYNRSLMIYMLVRNYSHPYSSNVTNDNIKWRWRRRNWQVLCVRRPRSVYYNRVAGGRALHTGDREEDCRATSNTATAAQVVVVRCDVRKIFVGTFRFFMSDLSKGNKINQ